MDKKSIPFDKLKFYYGIPHSHTSLSTGKSSPYESLEHARSNGLDFLIITDHNKYLSETIKEKNKEISKWEYLNKCINKFNKKHSDFLALCGFEAKSTTLGHLNILCPNTFFTGIIPDIKYLLLWLINDHTALLSINHPKNSIAKKFEFTPILDKLLCSIEVGNGIPPSTYTRYDSQFFSLLDKGFKLGAINSQDNHKLNQGDSENLTCVISHKLNKNSLLDAFKNRHIFSTESKTLKMLFSLNSTFMGGTITVDSSSKISLYLLNIYINSKERDRIKANGLMYLRRVIKASKQIVKINDKNLDDFNIKIRENLKDLKSIDRNTIMISFINMWGGVFEFISVLFLLEETAYYKIADSIEKNKDSILSLYKTLGEMEAIISIGSYEEEKKDKITRPKFIREITLEIKNGIHPIIENPVANSINMSKRGIVLTGTNMSGKSTFLRMLGVNMLFAQAFNFVLAEKYEGPIFNIVTSISPNDDLSVGKSFYMAEAESILRIIRALDKELPVFCAIDEIFRGTNPIERISASAEILTYINNKNSISIVATHDRELVDILKESYEFYYFSENVDSKNGLSFDYKLKRGVSKTRNAIKLLEYIGYPKDIINKSYRRSEKLEGFI